MTLITDGTPVRSRAFTLHEAYVQNYAEEMVGYAESAGGTVARTDRYVLADHHRPAGFMNGALLLGPPRLDLLDAVEEITARFSGAGDESVHLFVPWEATELETLGWRFGSRLTFSLRPPGGPMPSHPSDVRVREVRDEVGLADWESVIIAGFGLRHIPDRDGGRLLGPSILDDPRHRLWIAYDGDRPGAAAALHVDQGLAGFALGATVPESRRKGLWYALVRARLEAVPDLVSASVFSSDSRPGAERIGFLPAGTWTIWWRPRPEGSVPR